MMKKVISYIIKTVLMLVCVCLLYVQSVFASDYRVTLTDTEIKEVGREMYGLDFTFSSLNSFVNEDLSLNENVIGQFEDYAIPNSRMMGTASRFYKWKNSIGSYGERGYTGMYSLKKEKVGIVEWIKVVRAIDPEATFTFTLNLETDTAANAADLAEFLTGDGSVNYNGGINWAEKRKELGIEEPVSVIWELGNETDQSAAGLIYPFSAEDYVKVAKKFIFAIRKVDNNAIFAAHSATNSLSVENPSDQITNRGGWNRTVITNLQDYIDYFVFHSYGSIQQNYMKMKTNLDFAISDMKEQLKDENRDRIKLYFTEYSVYHSDADYKVGYQLKGALTVSEMINRLLLVPEVERANYHNFMNSHSRGAFYQTKVDGENEGAYKASVLGEMLDMYSDYGVGTVVESELEKKYLFFWTEGYKNDSEAGVTSAVVKNGNRYCVFLSNQMNESHNLYFSLPSGSYKLVGKRVISGPELTSSNWYSSEYPDEEETDEITVSEETLNTSISSSTNISVPKYSMSVYVIEKS